MTSQDRADQDQPDTPTPYRLVELGDESILARHAALVARDNVAGLEATVSRLERELETARRRARRLRAQLDERNAEISALRSSRTWKLGRLITRPLGRRR